MSDLTGFDIQLLRHLNGEDVAGLSWSAAMGESVEFLKGSGYITVHGSKCVLTQKGRDALRLCPNCGEAYRVKYHDDAMDELGRTIMCGCKR